MKKGKRTAILSTYAVILYFEAIFFHANFLFSNLASAASLCCTIKIILSEIYRQLTSTLPSVFSCALCRSSSRGAGVLSAATPAQLIDDEPQLRRRFNSLVTSIQDCSRADFPRVVFARGLSGCARVRVIVCLSSAEGIPGKTAPMRTSRQRPRAHRYPVSSSTALPSTYG